MAGLLPVLLLALFAGWCGTLPGSAGAWGVLVGHGALVAAALAGARTWDPLRLGRAGALLPAALVLTTLASWWASPVERAGRVGLVLLPAFLLLPAAVAAWWRGERSRQLGLRALALAVGAGALWSLADWAAGGSPRPALPLGHHNLLATWLAILLPLAAVGVRERGAWRVVAWSAGLAALAALGLTRSLGGLLALAAEAVVVALALPRTRRWLLPLAALVLVAGLPRLARVASGGDPSARARAVYFEAGWAGFAAGPLLGWGPGSVPWTAAAFLRPRPGVTPPGEVVGQLHALPLDLAYELGGTGLLIAAGLAVAFVRRRLAECREARDPELAVAALAALAGAGASALANDWLAVAALPVALTVAAGAGLAAGRSPASPAGDAPAGRVRSPRLAAVAWALAAAAVLAPLDLAGLAYDRAAAAASREEARRHLARAMELDPAFPLYAARLAWYEGEPDARRARLAAEGAPGVAALWLGAGVLEQEAAAEGWREALRRALALDPLSGTAAYYLLKGEPEGADAADCGARALLGEPRLAAATLWDGRESLRRQVSRRLLAWEGVDPGWREAMAAALGEAAGVGGPVADFGLGLDDGVGGLSLHVFGRRPWGAAWFSEPVDRARLEAVTLPPASSLPSSRAAAFPRAACAPRR